MSIRSEIRRRGLRSRWRFMDAVIAAKQRLPFKTREFSDRFGYVLVIPAVVLVGFLAVGIALLAWYSVLTFDPVEVFVYEYTLANWRALLTTSAYHQIYLRTTLYGVFVTLVTVTIAIPYAYLVIRIDRSIVRRVLLFGLFVPFFTGVVIRAYGWLIVLGQGGLLNWLLTRVGLAPQKFIGTPLAVVIGLVQYMLPFAVLMISPAIAGIDPDLERAAKNCGANQYQTFRHVVLPLAQPGLTAATIVVFTLTMANYAIPKLLGAGNASFVANFVYLKLFTSFNYPIAATMSLVLVVIASLVVFALFSRYGTGTLGTTVSDE